MSIVSSLLRWFFLSFVTLVMAIACTQQPQVSTPVSNSLSAPLVAGDISWVGYAGNYVANKKGFFAQEGLTVQDKSFPNSSEEITALLAGKLDIAWLASGDAIQVIEKDPSLK